MRLICQRRNTAENLVFTHQFCNEGLDLISGKADGIRRKVAEGMIQIDIVPHYFSMHAKVSL